MSAEAVTIERLCVRWRGAAPEAHAPATRLRLERLISTLDLRPPAMPPGAVLLIHRVDGLPPLTRLDRLSPEWVRQAQQRIAELYHSARPPASAPPDAACVLFADAADMLMQFTRAAVREPASLVQRWYWRELVPPASHTPGAALAAVWATQARALPPALSRLPLPEVCAALALLAPAKVGAVVRALAQHYALPPAVLPPFALSPSVAGAAPPVPPQAEVWRALLPAAPLPQPLPAHAAYLLGLSHALYHAPAQVRRLASAAPPASSPPASSPPPALASSPPPALASSPPPALASSPPPAPASSPLPSSPPPAPASSPLPSAPLKPLLPEGIETALGGALYLANVFGWLGWPQHAALSGWAMLEALARALLECADDDDPLWAVLAGLDGREPGDPLSEAAAPDAFHLPAAVRTRLGPGAASLPVAPLPAAVRARLGPGAALWAERMRGPVGATLEEMLGEPLAPLLARAGRLVLSQTHIDLYMGFDQISVAARRVGLDANPGWVPDLGYILLFHFVEEANA